MQGAGLPPIASYAGDWSSASGYAAGRQQFGAEAVPTAIFAANDQMALGVLSALAEPGLGVPDDVSVAGFDDVPDAAYFTPALTTVRQDFAALAARCVAVLEQSARRRLGHQRAHPPRAGRALEHRSTTLSTIRVRVSGRLTSRPRFGRSSATIPVTAQATLVRG